MAENLCSKCGLADPLEGIREIEDKFMDRLNCKIEEIDDAVIILRDIVESIYGVLADLKGEGRE